MASEQVVLDAVRVVLYKETEEVDDEAQDGRGHAARPVAVDGLVQHNDLEELVDVPGRGSGMGWGPGCRVQG